VKILAAVLALALPASAVAADCEYSHVAGGFGYSCAIAIPEKTLDCWGYLFPSFPGAGPHPGVATAAVSVGYTESCIVRDDDDTLECWGDTFTENCTESIWDGTEPAGTFLDVGVEWVEACALATDGSIECFGRTQADADCRGLLYLDTPGGTGHTHLTVGTFSACAITGAGALACWGDIEDDYGPAPAGTFIDVSCNYDGCCAINASGGIECWGDDFYGQVTDAPVATDFVRLSDAGFEAEHMCAMDATGNVECWGYDNDNQVSGLPASLFDQINHNSWFTCGITTDSHVECWGNDLATGAVDDAPTVDTCVPAAPYVVINVGM
jgi:hypothetical protein